MNSDEELQGNGGGGGSDGVGTTTNTTPSGFQRFKDKFLPGIQVTLLISLLFYIALFVIGIWGLNKCPVEEYIPFFLIVTGGIGLFCRSVTLVRERFTLRTKNAQTFETVLYTLELVFLLFGTFWVLKEFQPNYNPNTSNYCNKTVYILAFVYLMLNYSFIVMLLLGFCCFLACIFFIKATEAQQEIDAEAQNNTP